MTEKKHFNEKIQITPWYDRGVGARVAIMESRVDVGIGTETVVITVDQAETARALGMTIAANFTAEMLRPAIVERRAYGVESAVNQARLKMSKAPKDPFERLQQDALDKASIKAMYEAAWEKGEKDAVTVANGKYTFVKFASDYRVFILRYDEPWVVIEQGCNAVTALMNHVMELEGGR